MITTTQAEEKQRAEFLEEAISTFKKHPALATYGTCEAGTLFALKWGLLDRSVLVFRLDRVSEPIVYRDAIIE